MTMRIGRFYSDLTLQGDVVNALILRELHTRFGRHNVGYLWMIGEPLMLSTVIGSLHAFQPAHLGSNMAPVPFSLIGYCIFIIFRGVFGRSEGIIEGNLPLFYHSMVSPLNLSVARLFIEVTGCVSSLVILMTLAILLGYGSLPARPLELYASIGLMSWFSFAMGLNCSFITFDRPTLGRLVHPFTYLMMPVSGAFFPIEWAPKVVRDFQVWNPMALIFEIARHGMFADAPDDYLYSGYVCAICAILTYTGLIGLRRIKSRVHLS